MMDFFMMDLCNSSEEASPNEKTVVVYRPDSVRHPLY